MRITRVHTLAKLGSLACPITPQGASVGRWNECVLMRFRTLFLCVQFYEIEFLISVWWFEVCCLNLAISVLRFQPFDFSFSISVLRFQFYEFTFAILRLPTTSLDPTLEITESHSTEADPTHRTKKSRSIKFSVRITRVHTLAKLGMLTYPITPQGASVGRWN